MDPFDEFEFKPLTDGLGFYKKSATLKDQIKSSGVMEEHLESLPVSLPRFEDEQPLPRKPMTFEDVIQSLEKTPLKASAPAAARGRLEMTEPLPRTKTPPKKMSEVQTPRPIQSPFPSQDLFRQPAPPMKKTPPAPEMAKAGTRRGAADSPQQGRLVPTNTSVSSALLDLIVIAALSLIFMAALLMTTKVDLGVVLRGVNGESWTRISLGLLFLAIMQMYVVISRSFYGQTLGEWTFDVQLGRKQDQQDDVYPLKVVARSILVTLTGVVLLPLLS